MLHSKHGRLTLTFIERHGIKLSDACSASVVTSQIYFRIQLKYIYMCVCVCVCVCVCFRIRTHSTQQSYSVVQRSDAVHHLQIKAQQLSVVMIS
jgi:hypothetical protein